jgi:hypothetical protein
MVATEWHWRRRPTRGDDRSANASANASATLSAIPSANASATLSVIPSANALATLSVIQNASARAANVGEDVGADVDDNDVGDGIGLRRIAPLGFHMIVLALSVALVWTAILKPPSPGQPLIELQIVQ